MTSVKWMVVLRGSTTNVPWIPNEFFRSDVLGHPFVHLVGVGEMPSAANKQLPIWVHVQLFMSVSWDPCQGDLRAAA